MGQARAALPAEPTSPAAARRFVMDTLTGWGLRELADPAALLVSELVTNALVHGRSPVRVELSRKERVLHVEVTDLVGGWPTRRHHGPDATTGRGLALVEALASAWGVASRADGKSVWFQLRLARRA